MIIQGWNAPAAYEEAIWKLRICGKRENSRNGEVISIPYPVLLEIEHPEQRLITDPVRDANPFFHCMEFIWMMAGSNDVTWLSQFNKRMLEYSDDGKTLHAAYGKRWRDWPAFEFDQIKVAVDMLKRNREDRRIVLQMWDAAEDLASQKKDLPCNTQILLRVVNDSLDFLVTNRSNDLFWGMFGANIVHMTMLQELMAQAAGLKIGTYRVVSNNLHAYTGMPRFTEIFNSPTSNHCIYEEDGYVPLLAEGEKLEYFFGDCDQMVSWEDRDPDLKTEWMRRVGYPIWSLWFSRNTSRELNDIKDDYWRKACKMWLERRSHG
jgi:thymidylate synthase